MAICREATKGSQSTHERNDDVKDNDSSHTQLMKYEVQGQSRQNNGAK